MATNKITLNEFRNLIKQIINEEIKSDSYEQQKNWSTKKSRMYDAYSNAHNKIKDLEDELKMAKGRKDNEEIKKIQNRIRENKFAKKAAKEEFDKL